MADVAVTQSPGSWSKITDFWRDIVDNHEITSPEAVSFLASDDNVDLAGTKSGTPPAPATSEQGAYGFDTQIPVAVFIKKVELLTEHWASLGSPESIERARVGGVDLPAHSNFPSGSRTAETYDITAERTWTRSDLLDGTLATRLTAQASTAQDAQVRWDYIKVRATYEEPNRMVGMA